MGLNGKTAKVYMTDETHIHDEIEADLTALILPKDAILYIEY